VSSRVDHQGRSGQVPSERVMRDVQERRKVLIDRLAWRWDTKQFRYYNIRFWIAGIARIAGISFR